MTDCHPRESKYCTGHESVERDVLAAWNAGRMPHAWLLTGTKGIGKATFAYRLASFVLATPPVNPIPDLFGHPNLPTSLSLSEHHPIHQRLTAGSVSDLLVLEGQEDGKDIGVDDVRRLSHFLRLTPSESAWKVVIIDSIDDLNRQASNALLKILEEPPSYALIVLISHAPFGLLPTIRSRCRVVKMQVPPSDQFESFLRESAEGISTASLRQLALLSAGAPGLASLLYDEEGLSLYADLLSVMGSLPSHARDDWAKITSACVGESKGSTRLEVLRMLCQILCHRLATYEVLKEFFSEQEQQVLYKMRQAFRVPYWLSLFERYDGWLTDCSRIHLDKSHILLSMISDLEQRYHV